MRKVRLFFGRLVAPIFTFFGLILVLLAVFVGALMIWPQLIVNPYFLKLATKAAAKHGIEIHWNSINIQIDSLALLRKKFNFKFTGLCVAIKEKEFSGCSSDAKISLTASFSRFKPHLVDLGPIEISQFQWNLFQDKEKIDGILNVKTKNKKYRDQSGFQSLAQGSFEGAGIVNLPDRSRFKMSALVDFNKNEKNRIQMGYAGELHYSKQRSRAVLYMKGFATQNQLVSRISGELNHFSSQVPRIVLNDCHLKYEKQPPLSALEGFKETNEKGQLQANCPVLFKIPVPPSPLNDLNVPTELGGVIGTHLTTSQFPPSSDSKIVGTIGLKLNPILSPFFHGQGELKANLSGIISDFPNAWIAEAEVGLNVRVPYFQNVVARLQHGPWAVPAPFHVLNGMADLRLDGKTTLDQNFKQGKFPFKFQTLLNSRAQKLDLKGDGVFTLDQNKGKTAPDLQFDLVLSNVALELPRLDWSAPPPLFPDSRIRQSIKTIKNVESQKSHSAFHYQLTFHTDPKQPAKIISNLAQSPIPVRIDLKIGDSTPLQGIIKIDGFPTEVFRRQAKIDHFLLGLSSPSQESTIYGLVSVNYADYLIIIKIDGTLDKPQIHLSSEPSLPETQLIAVLLFGRPLDELDSDQGNSVGSTRAALTDGAIGLASFYVLASTPIESVGYDPTTGQVMAKVRLGDGTSLNLGRDADSSKVGIRKRLGKFWTIETSVGANATRTGEVATAYLQWSHRY